MSCAAARDDCVLGALTGSGCGVVGREKLDGPPSGGRLGGGLAIGVLGRDALARGAGGTGGSLAWLGGGSFAWLGGASRAWLGGGSFAWLGGASRAWLGG